MQLTISKYTFLLSFLLVMVLSAIIVWPFLTPILAGVLLAYIFYPLYTMIREKVKNENISATLTTLIILLVVSLPFIMLVGAVAKDIKDVYVKTKDRIALQGFFVQKPGECTGRLCDTKEKIDALITQPEFIARVQNALARLTASFIQYSSEVLLFLPKVLVKMFIMVFVMFFGFRDGERFMTRLYNLIPLEKTFKQDLKKQTSDLIFATVYGTIIVGLIQGFSATIGYFIFGVSSPLLLGALTALFAILPFVGSSLVWFPVGLVEIIAGLDGGNTLLIWKGIGIMLYGFFLVSSIDSFVKPKIIGDRSNVHPAVILIGIFGGLAALGPIGLVIGPVVLATGASFIRVYEKDKKRLIM